MTAYYDIVKALGSEIVLVVTALVALAYDLGWARRYELQTRVRSVGRVVGLGLLIAVFPLLPMCTTTSLRILDGVLVVNQLSTLLKGILILLTLLAVILSMESDIGRHVGEYFSLLLFGAIGMMVLVSTEELITVFVALELLSICLYILTAAQKQLLKSQEAALKYFLFGAISSAFLLFGLSYLVGITGTTFLRPMAQLAGVPGPLLSVALLFILVGFGFKVAVVPFHLWAPDAYEGAPTPVTAYIATGSKVASFVILLKLLLVGLPALQGQAFWGQFKPGWAALLAIIATLSMILDNIAAIVQRNVKRLLAYSSIAHAGYILIGIIAATTMGTASVLFYVIVYGLTNLGAFGVIAALSRQAGGEDMIHFNGMARRAPWLSLFMLIFILSLAGVPPLGGFFGKFYLFAAAVGRDATNFGLLWLVVLGIFMSAVSLYYYLIVLKHFYVIESTQSSRVQTPTYLTVMLGLVALSVVVLGVYPEPLLALLNQLVGQL